MKKIILGLAGEIGSGKGTVAKYLQEKYGADSYRFSDPLRKILKILAIPESRDNLQDLSTLLRQKFGEDLLAKVIYHAVKENQNKLVVVDGMRRLADFKYLDTLPEFVFVYIEADGRVRYQRILDRKENPGDAEKTFDQFVQDQKDEADAQIRELKPKAQQVIENNGSLTELQLRIDELISLKQK